MKTGQVLLVLSVVAPASIAAAPQTSAQVYPTKPISITVPFPPGGAADVIARLTGEKFQQTFKQPVTIENRPGAGGSLGSGYVFRSKSDGYNLLSAPSAPIIINQFTQKSISYDPSQFSEIAFLAIAPLVLTVRSDFPARTVAEFAEYVKQNSSKINYASNGVGGTAHIGTLLLQKALGVTGTTHIPYQGAAPALLALLSGDAQFFLDNLSSTLPFVQDQKMRVLALGSKERSALLPDVPTFEEVGLRDLVLVTWFGLFGPPALPPEIVESLNQEVRRFLKEPDVSGKIGALGLQTVQMNPEEMKSAVSSDRARWRAAIEEAGLPKN